MMWTFLIVLLVGASLATFSTYWLSLVKRIFSIPGAKLFLPIIAISWFMLTSETWVVWTIQLMHAAFHYTVYKIDAILPSFKGNVLLVKVCLMAVLAWLPTYLIWLTSKPYRPFDPPYWASFYVFLLLTVLVVLR